MYWQTLYAGWGDMDFNAHMRNTAYLDKAGDLRMMFFRDHGFPASEFARLRFGPVVMKDELEYFREVGLLEDIRVGFALAGVSADGARYRLRNEFLRSDGLVAARVTTTGGWLDLATRKLVPPPAGLLAALESLPRTDDFAMMNGRPSLDP